MNIRIFKNTNLCVNNMWFYPACLFMMVILFVLSPFTDSGFIWIYLGIFAMILWTFRPSSQLYKETIENLTGWKRILTVLAAVVTVIACIWPMDRLPTWNGVDPGHRTQYELMAEAILQGHVYIDYGDEEEMEQLEQLENPYDPQERIDKNIVYRWDHAYYDGHYYMYFGVVPVFLIFLPYRIITGMPLTTYHATQVFVAVFIIGIFVLFRLLAKLFFKNLSFWVYLALSVSFSVMSVWYSTVEPALYCTAITCAMVLEIWSLYFYIRAVWAETRENRQIAYAFIGAFLGALAFGCRPPIALANILVLPMLIIFLHQRKITLKLVGKLILAALPYIIIGAALMTYNYVRFDDPFEFGQAYQLTAADQTQYKISLDLETINRVARDGIRNFFDWGYISSEFPYLQYGGVFFNFPVLLLCFGILKSRVRTTMRQNKILSLVIGFFVTVLIIVFVDIMWSPYLLERYRMDIYFLLGIACFGVIGFWQKDSTVKTKSILNFTTIIFSIITLCSSVAFHIATATLYDANLVNAVKELLHI